MGVKMILLLPTMTRCTTLRRWRRGGDCDKEVLKLKGKGANPLTTSFSGFFSFTKYVEKVCSSGPLER